MATLRGYRAFSDEEARMVKENLVRGVTVAAIAQYYGVSVETISKIKRGLTYTHVRVEGEEQLRPANALGERVIPRGPLAQPVRKKTEAEIDAAAEESQKRLFEMLGLGPDGLPKEG
jgi:transposase-like protein